MPNRRRLDYKIKDYEIYKIATFIITVILIGVYYVSLIGGTEDKLANVSSGIIVAILVILTSGLVISFISYEVFDDEKALVMLFVHFTLLIEYLFSFDYVLGLNENSSYLLIFPMLRMFYIIGLVIVVNYSSKEFLDKRKTNKVIRYLIGTSLAMILSFAIMRRQNLLLNQWVYNVIICINIMLLLYIVVIQIKKINRSIELNLGISILLLLELSYISIIPLREEIDYYFFIMVGMLFISLYIYNSSIKVYIDEYKREKEQFSIYLQNFQKILYKQKIEERKTNKILGEELEYARKIQQSLLPKENRVYRNVRFQAEYFPCDKLSGDLYDIYRIDDDNIGIYVLDVSGHGIPAALMTMFSNNYIKSTTQELELFRGLNPDQNLLKFYEKFNNMNFPSEMHMVMFYASYNLSTNILTYCTGGINCLPLLIHRDGDYEYLDKSKGFPICQLSKYYTPEYSKAKIKLEKGDRIVFYTDGLIDEDKNKVFDTGSLEEFLLATKNVSGEKLNNMIVKKVDERKEHRNDDITYIIMDI